MAEEWNVCEQIAKFREELAKLPEENRPYWDDLYDKYLIVAEEYDMLKEMGIPYQIEKARKEEREKIARYCNKKATVARVSIYSSFGGEFKKQITSEVLNKLATELRKMDKP